MSATALATPLVTVRRTASARPARARHLQPCGPASRALAPQTVRPMPIAARPKAAAPLRLTARGRSALLLLVCLSLAVPLVSGMTRLATLSADPVPVQYVTVHQGESLWTIAGEVAPDADRRDTVAQIRHLNDMTHSTVLAGQRILVPLRP